MNNYKQLSDIDTPALIIDETKMMRNLEEMQAFANANNIKLRPHVKTHKIPEIARIQLSLGAAGIAASKIAEAEVFADAGIDDIQIANLIVGRQKYRRLLALKRKVRRLTCCVESEIVIREMDKFFSDENEEMEVFIKIDVGFGRCGLSEKADILSLAQKIGQSRSIRLAGILTHAGQAYAADSKDKLNEIALHEIEKMNSVAKILISNGIRVDEISVGSTPTARSAHSINGPTELRAGNYVFYDMIQVMLGAVDIERCAQRVLATVVGVYPDGRAVIDAGSKALGLDMGGHGNATLNSHGYINDHSRIVRLSEEHGVINYSKPAQFLIADRIEIIPNHACAVQNLYDRAYLVKDNKIIKELAVAARGKSQ